jgi:endonuclease/exonuclease/phosphatase family metal-dependent hydrolase
MTLAATIRVGDRRVEVYSFHLESGLLDGRYRDAQALELVEDAARRPFPRVLGGDSNPWTTWAGLSDHLPVWARLRMWLP